MDIKDLTDGIGLGDLAQDTITGFEGIIDGITVWMSGTRECKIQPRDLKDGKPIEAVWFECPRVKILEEAVIMPPTFGEMKFQFGQKVRCVVNGAVGIIMGVGFWMHGCMRYTIMHTSTTRDGKTIHETYDGDVLEAYVEPVSVPSTPPVSVPEPEKIQPTSKPRKSGGPEVRQTSSARSD